MKGEYDAFDLGDPRVGVALLGTGCEAQILERGQEQRLVGILDQRDEWHARVHLGTGDPGAHPGSDSRRPSGRRAHRDR